MRYPASFSADTGGYVVTFRDIPEAITQGDDANAMRAQGRRIDVVAAWLPAPQISAEADAVPALVHGA